MIVGALTLAIATGTLIYWRSTLPYREAVTDGTAACFISPDGWAANPSARDERLPGRHGLAADLK